MRIVDVVLASVLLGMTLGLVHTGMPAHAFGNARVAATDCSHSVCPRLTWLRTPRMGLIAASE